MRKIYIDFLRLLALFYMFFQHSVLALLSPEDNIGIINFLYELVPICPALFLFLSGFSLTFKFEKSDKFIIDKSFLFNNLKRGIILILCSQLLFFFEHGLQFPDIVIASGILNSIGFMLIISAFLLRFKYKKTIFSIFTLILVILTVIFEKFNIYFVPFNYGYEPMSPTITYGFFGVLFALFLFSFKEAKNRSRFVGFSGILGFAIVLFYTLKYGPGKVFSFDFGRYEIFRHFSRSMMPQNLFFNGGNETSMYTATIWNYNTPDMIASFGSVLALFSIAFFLEPFFQRAFPKNIFLPGKYSFVNYFYHLIVIALFVVIFDYGIFNKIWLIVFLLLLFVFSYLMSFFIEYNIFKKCINALAKLFHTK